jgi:hypothetical protein
MTRLRIVERRLLLAATMAMVFAGLPASTVHPRPVMASNSPVAAARHRR